MSVCLTDVKFTCSVHKSLSIDVTVVFTDDVGTTLTLVDSLNGTAESGPMMIEDSVFTVLLVITVVESTVVSVLTRFESMAVELVPPSPTAGTSGCQAKLTSHLSSVTPAGMEHVIIISVTKWPSTSRWKNDGKWRFVALRLV